MQREQRWNVSKDSIKDKEACKVIGRFNVAKGQMQQRTSHHELYGLLAKNKSIHEWSLKRGRTKYFSEGSTQYILRKVLADTIQRVPDGELVTQYDKGTKESVLLNFIFENKVMQSEFEGLDMMGNLTKAFKMAFIYAFAPVRTGFVKSWDDSVRISFNLEQWSDVFINPDCKDICRPEVVYHRSYLSKDEVLALIDDDGEVYDSTYERDTIRYVVDHQMFSSKMAESEKLADRMKGSTAIQSLELVTEYRRGADEFVTYVPSLNAVFRRVKNYDPRKGIPWNFLVLEPDADFPIGISQVEFLLADQQFNDLFQTSAYKNLLLAMEPPIMVAGWETNPSSYRYEPRKIWNLGNNPNNVKVEPVKIENSILSGWTTTREAVAASMLRSLNVTDGTVAKDSGTTFSKTAPGVEAQIEAKTININQYQKRVEIFIQSWAEQALRMYVNAMNGKVWITVNEETRRRLMDIEEFDCIDGNKVEFDFSALSADAMEFRVRSGSLIQRKEDQQLEKLTTMVQPIIQNLNGWSDQNRSVIENEVLLPVTKRMIELSDTDIAMTMADSLSTQIAKNMLAGMQQQMNDQQMQIDNQQMQINQMQQGMPEQQEQLAQEPFAGSQAPMPQENPALAGATSGGEGSFAESPESPNQEETPDQQVLSYEDMLYL